MTPDDTPRVQMTLQTRSELLDGPLHREEAIAASAMMLFYIDHADRAGRAAVHSAMMGTGNDLVRLALAALDWFDQKLDLERLLVFREIAQRQSVTEIREEELIRDQIPHKD